MKILWLTETPSKYKPEEFGYNGRGWIASLQTLVENSPEIDQLGIAFPHLTDSQAEKKNKISYFPIKRKKPGNIITWIISNWKNKIEDEKEINDLVNIIKDFDPDIIHIFGTESWLCNAVRLTHKPCVVHLQGLLLPCYNAYNPVDISKYDLIRYNWTEFAKGISLWHNKKVFEKKSKREYRFFKEINFFMGRTIWDKSISELLSSNSVYFHVDEVLRDKFYVAPAWKLQQKTKIIITSTLSDALYKGLDLVIKTAILLIKEKIDFEWRIIGVRNDSKTAQLLKKKLHIDYSSLNIHLLGIKDTDEIIDLLLETRFYVHTSYIDNSPNSLCEAQYLGVPVIATNVGGISSLIKDEDDGILVPANDPYFLASKIVQINMNSLLLSRISAKAKENAHRRHLKENILNQVIQAYKHLSQNKSISKIPQPEKLLVP